MVCVNVGSSVATTLPPVRVDVGSGRDRRCVSVREIFVLASQFCYEPILLCKITCIKMSYKGLQSVFGIQEAIILAIIAFIMNN